MRIALLATAAKFGFIALLAQGVAATAAEIRVMAGAACREPSGSLSLNLSAPRGTRSSSSTERPGLSKRQIEGGEEFDLAIFGSAGVDDLIKQGKISGDTRVDIARVGTGVAVREGASKPDISSVDAFKNTLLSAKSITYTPESATGPAKVIDRLGITEQVKDKIKPNPPDRVPQVVAAGEVELAIGSAPSLVSAKGVHLVGLLPADLQNWFVNTAGVSAAAKQPDAAKALIKHLTTPEAAAAIKAKGMEPLGK